MQFNGYQTTNFPNGVSTTLAATNNGTGAPYSGLNTGAIGEFSSVTTLTAAQVLALNATPVQLLPAPGANLAILLRGFALELLFNTTAFTNTGNATLRFNLSSTLATNTIYTFGSLSGFSGLITAASTSFLWSNTSNTTAGTKASLANQPLYVDLSAAVAAGDGQLKISTWFSVVPV